MEEVRAAGARNHHRRRNFPKTRKETEVEGGRVRGWAIDRNKISEERSRPLQRGVKLSTGSPCLCASWQDPDCEREGCWRSQTCRRAPFPFTDLHDFFLSFPSLSFSASSILSHVFAPPHPPPHLLLPFYSHQHLMC